MLSKHLRPICVILCLILILGAAALADGFKLQRGDSGQAVEVWQTILGIDADGDFGPTTQAYTIAFQRKMGLTADGIVGKTTWNKGLYLD